jgi:pimeloyl-ACP methyl ester carboxylesterase
MHSTILTNNYMHIEAEILNFIIHEKEIHNPILFGHSDGGNIALLSAAINKNILGVICEAGHIYVEEITLQGILKSIDIYKYTDLKLKLEKYHAEKVECIFKAWTNIWLDEKFRYWNIINEIKNIECPLLFIQGEDDEYGSLQQVLDTMLHVKGERNCYILPHTKHTPHKEAAQKVLVQSSQFINSII